MLDFVVIIHRYDKPEDRWGVVECTYEKPATPPPAYHWYAGFHQTTPPRLLSSQDCARKLQELQENDYRLVPIDLWPAGVQEYVFFQIAPIEWHGRLRELDEELTDRCTVYIKGDQMTEQVNPSKTADDFMADAHRYQLSAAEITDYTGQLAAAVMALTSASLANVAVAQDMVRAMSQAAEIQGLMVRTLNEPDVPATPPVLHFPGQQD